MRKGLESIQIALLEGRENHFITFGKDLEILNHENEIVISKASEWFGANSMHLNKDKTVSLLFTLKESQELATISRTDTKFLGIYVDSRLSWSTRIEYLKDKKQFI